LRFEEITSARLAGLFASLITEGRRRGAARGPGLSPTTIRYLFGITHRILSDAVIAGLLASNPATGIRLPRIASSGGRELFCWSASELREFLDFTHGHELASAWRLAAFTGMRRGEVLGLRVSDVDLARRRLSVSRALSVSASQVIESTPKNGRSRVIDLDRATTDHLAQLIADRPRSERVIVRADGSSPPPDSVSRRFRLAVVDSGLPRIRLHDLRHTHATLSLGAGVPIRVISERLGHSSPEFTLRRYAHVLPGMGAEAAETFAALLENEKPEGQREI
jgi:integrase